MELEEMSTEAWGKGSLFVGFSWFLLVFCLVGSLFSWFHLVVYVACLLIVCLKLGCFRFVCLYFGFG